MVVCFMVIEINEVEIRFMGFIDEVCYIMFGSKFCRVN